MLNASDKHSYVMVKTLHTITIATGCDIEHCKRKPNSHRHEKHVEQTQPLMAEDKHNLFCSDRFQKLSIGHR